MATVFLPRGRKLYSAQIKVWDKASGKLVWKKIATGCESESAALEVALTLERASGEVRAGSMTRAKVERLVDHILHLSGFSDAAPAETLEHFGGRFMAARVEKVSRGTREKYEQHWASFTKWAGPRLKRRLAEWQASDMEDYYAHVLGKVSAGTANDHLRTMAMIFKAAIAHQHITANPVNLVEKQRPERAEKVPITREEYGKVLEVMAQKQRRDWHCLTRLGWHTGHRIQDLMSLTSENLCEMDGVECVRFRPAKKKGQNGREVVLPLPDDLADEFRALGSFRTIRGGSNDTGKASNDFVDWLKLAGVDPMPVQKKSRVVHLKSFHSFRHAMTSRLIAAGVTGEVARLVTDHDSAEVQKIYTHAEVKALAEALAKVR